MAVVIVERSFGEPIQSDEIQAMKDRGGGCAEAYGVRFLRSFFSTDRRRMICLYEALDADSVREVQRKAGLPFERVWTASVVEA